MIKVIPSILTPNLADAKDLIAQLEGLVDSVQIDIIDGVFAENKTIDPTLLVDIETSLEYDFHLMVKDPINWIEKCAGVGAKRIVAQIELMEDQTEFVTKVHGLNMAVGLGLDLTTDVSQIKEELLVEIDVILLMSVPAGFGGQNFDTNVFKKIEWLQNQRAKMNSSFVICDDGGVTLENVDDVHFLGVDEVVVGRKLFEGDVKTNLDKYQEAAHKLNAK